MELCTQLFGDSCIDDAYRTLTNGKYITSQKGMILTPVAHADHADVVAAVIALILSFLPCLAWAHSFKLM